MARHGIMLCNGGYGGTMEAAARGAKEHGGSTIGVTVEVFPNATNPWIDRELRQPDLFHRLMKLVELGEAYIVLKGGTGTLLELACVWELVNKKLIAEKPIVLVGLFWNAVVETLREELEREGFAFIHQTNSPEEAVQYIVERRGRG